MFRSNFSISKIYKLSILQICRNWTSLNTVLWIPPFQQWQDNRIRLYRLACFCAYLTKLKILAVLLFGLCHCLCLYTRRYEAKRGWDRMSPLHNKLLKSVFACMSFWPNIRLNVFCANFFQQIPMGFYFILYSVSIV